MTRPAAHLGRPTYDDHRAYDAALARACPEGHADAGRPCFDGGGVVGLCGARTSTEGDVA